MGGSVPHWTALIEHAAKGWTVEEPEAARKAVNLFREKLRADVEVVETGNSYIAFIAGVHSIRLRGMSEMACLIVGGREKDVETAVRHFWQLVSGPEQLSLVLGLADGSEHIVNEIIPRGFVCVLNANGLGALLSSNTPHQDLTRHMRDQIPPRRLIPYVTKHAVSGNMFFGRRHELDQLIDDDTGNFAIAGQGRIGKSSLIREYVRLIKKAGERRRVMLHVDFYPCQPRSEGAISQFLAKHIDGSTSRSAHMTPEDLDPFLRFHANRNGRPFELLLDEVDLVCHSNTFHQLAHLSRHPRGPIARLILVGRGELLREVRDEKSPLKEHVSLMRLEPLEHRQAEQLVKEPCAAMGLRFSDDEVVEDVLRLTGCLPQMLQFVGSKLMNAAFTEATDVITRQHVERIWQDYETTQTLMSSFENLSEAVTRLVAALIVSRDVKRVDEGVVIALAASVDIRVEAPRARQICDDLLLANFLSWKRSGYQMANEALSIRLRETEALRDTLQSARAEAQGSRL